MRIDPSISHLKSPATSEGMRSAGGADGTQGRAPDPFAKGTHMKIRQPVVLFLGGLLYASSVGCSAMIETVRGAGYRLTRRVNELSA